jgi:hypothetical protein
MAEFYDLRWHVALVLEQLERQTESAGSSPVSSSELANQSDIPQNPSLGPRIAKAA